MPKAVKYVRRPPPTPPRELGLFLSASIASAPTPPSRPSGATSLSSRAIKRRSRLSAGRAPRTRSVPSASPGFEADPRYDIEAIEEGVPLGGSRRLAVCLRVAVAFPVLTAKELA